MSDASSDANKALTRQFFRRISAADLSAVDELVSDDFVEHEQVPGLAPGKAGMRQWFEMFHSAFDPAGLKVDDMIAEGDKVFVLARMTGTQRGEFMGIAATGHAIDVSICDYFRVGHGALIEHWEPWMPPG
jgi:ketosteroid isomerase-like protein